VHQDFLLSRKAFFYVSKPIFYLEGADETKSLVLCEVHENKQRKHQTVFDICHDIRI